MAAPIASASAPSWGNAGHIATEQVEPLASPNMLRSALRRHYLLGGALDIRKPLEIAPWIARYVRACSSAQFEAGRDALRDLLADALPAWARLTSALHVPHLLRDSGHWVCWESAASAARGRDAWHASDTGTARFAGLPPAQLEQLRDRVTAQIADAIAFEGTAQIADLPELSRAFADAFEHNQGERRFVRIDSLQATGNRVQARAQDGSLIDADRILVCAGVHSRPLMESVDVRAPVIAERGYHLQWSSHSWPELPPVVFEDRSMIVTLFDSGLRAASFVEFAPVNTPPDEGKWQRLRRHVEQLGLPVQGEPAQWFGARPTLPDYLPAIGRSERFDNLVYAFGHQHLGLTLAALTGEIVGGLCDDENGQRDLSPFDLQRFA